MRKIIERQRKKIIIGLGLVILLLAWKLLAGDHSQVLRVYVLDVGQGDAIYIAAPSGQKVLIDGGPDKSVLERLGEITPVNDRGLDLVILTHPHADHLSGLIPVLERYQVGRILYSGINYQNQSYAYFLNFIEKNNLPATIFSGPGKISLGADCSLSLLYPLSDLSGANAKDINGTSIVSRLDCAGKHFLFMGDAGTAVEKKLLAQEEQLPAEVIKIGHHGSATASSNEFLSAVNPGLAVISVGKGNSYHLPATSTVDNLSGRGIKVWRTDQDDSLLIEVQNGQITYKKP